MKISQEKKREVRKTIIRTAVELMSEQGFGGASMREIARGAGLGDATIYSYFPSKEKILYAYFEDKLEDTIDEIKNIEGFAAYSLQEKLQELLESNLSALLGDREFVEQALGLAFITPMGKLSDAAAARTRLTDTVSEFLKQAHESGEIQDPPAPGVIAALFWDYYLGILMYWLKDDSDEFAQTSQLIDMSLGLFLAFLKSEILDRISDLFSFFIRNHMFSALELLSKNLGDVQSLMNKAAKPTEKSE